MTTSNELVRSRFRALNGGCVTCSGDLAPVENLPGVTDIDALASGLVLVTHDATVTPDDVVNAARTVGLTLAPAGKTRPARPA